MARPKIGLALGGGGAKGGAHIGVLKVLERERIPVDLIAGTSIGSMIGALYALGYGANEIEAIMLSVPWSEGYSDTIPRQNLPFRNKQRGQFNLPLNLGYENAELKTPSGFLYGQKASMLLRQAMGNLSTFSSFDDLPIPYRAIATNLSTNDSVRLSSGDLLTATRASSSVPGILAPIKYGDMLLVDGGITNNIPIDVVQSMGADNVIAIDIGDNLVGKHDLTSTFSILAQLSSFLTVASAEKQKILLTEGDIIIRPEIDHLSTTDWSTFSDGIIAGEKAAQHYISALQVLSLSEEEYQAYRQQKKHKHEQLLNQSQSPITEITIQNESLVNEAFIRKQLALPVNQNVDRRQLNQAIQRVYETDEFQRVDAEIVDNGSQRKLIVSSEGKSWGPNFLEFGLGWETNFTDKSAIDLDFAYMATNLTKYGGEWRTQLELGNETALNTELYFPLTSVRSFYSRGKYSFESIDLNVPSSFQLPLSLEQNNNRLIHGFGYNFTRNSFIELGAIAEKGQISNDALLNDKINYDAFGSYLSFGFDNLDSASFPTHGKRLVVRVTNRLEDVKNTSFFNGDLTQLGGRTLQLQVEWKGALKIGSHSIVTKTDFSRTYTDKQDSSVYISRLGGFLNLSGYDSNELSGPHKAFTALIYQYNLRENLFGQTKLPLYLGFSAEAGNIWGHQADIDLKDMIFGGSLYLGTDTVMGPVALGYGYNNENEQSVYFYLGYEL